VLGPHLCSDFNVYCLLFTILRLFGTRESIRRKVDHGVLGLFGTKESIRRKVDHGGPESPLNKR